MSGEPKPGFLDAETLFRRHASYVARFLSRLGVPVEDLDDVVQEVFLVAHARGGYTPGPAKPTSYLGAIATRAAASHRRRLQRQTKRTSAVGPDALQSERPGPVQALIMSEAGQALHEALGELDPVLAATLLLVEQDGESCRAVAAAMGTAVGTIHWRLHKARKKLQQSLRRRGVTRLPATGLEAVGDPHGKA